MVHHSKPTFTITVWRHNMVVHVETAATRAEADQLIARYEQMPDTDVVLDERHEVADLTTLTRELVEERQG